MQDKIARQVHQVFGYGLELKERLERRGTAALRGRADQAPRAACWATANCGTWPNTPARGRAATASNIRTSQGRSAGAEPFLGIRYALACWVDEIFIADSPWSQQWTESMMEVSLYGGSSLRAVRFWEQAKKAEARPGTDALEVFLWCVMLGFRGEPARGRDQPAAVDRRRPQAGAGRLLPGVPAAARKGPADVRAGPPRAGAVRHHAPGGRRRRRPGRVRRDLLLIQGPAGQ